MDGAPPFLWRAAIMQISEESENNFRKSRHKNTVSAVGKMIKKRAQRVGFKRSNTDVTLCLTFPVKGKRRVEICQNSL